MPERDDQNDSIASTSAPPADERDPRWEVLLSLDPGTTVSRLNVSHSRPSAVMVVALTGASFGIVFMLYMMGQVAQLLNMPLGLAVTSLFIFGAAGLGFPALWGQRPLAFTRINRNPGWLVLLAVVLSLANIPFADFLMGAAKELLPASWGDMADTTVKLLVKADSKTRLIVILAAAFAAPVGEELFFRGWMQGLLARRFRLPASVLATAVIFSLIHLDPVGFIARIELGVVFSLASIWTGSLWGGITVHVVHNLTSMMGLYLSTDPLSDLDTPYDWTMGTISGAVSLVLTLGLLMLFRRLAHRRPEPAPAVEPPLRLTPVEGMSIAIPALAALIACTGLLYEFQKQLPGAELTHDTIEKILHPSKPHPKP